MTLTRALTQALTQVVRDWRASGDAAYRESWRCGDPCTARPDH